jgi:hypothetical protein
MWALIFGHPFRPSTWNNWMDFGDFLCCGVGSGSVYKNISKKLKFGQNRTIIKAALNADLHTCFSNVTFVTVDNNR